VRTWRRAFITERCGRCGKPIETGAPVQEIQPLAGLRRPKLRCVACADEAEPVDLPALVARQIPMTPMAHIRTGLDTLPLDFKQRQMGREPGEDDD